MNSLNSSTLALNSTNTLLNNRTKSSSLNRHSSHMVSSSSSSAATTATKTGLSHSSNNNSHITSSLTYLNNQPLNTPFELTNRIEVNLPFNQKTVVRVKPDILLVDLFNLVCKEACLDKEKYELVINDKSMVDLMQSSFAKYNTREITLVHKREVIQASNQASTLKHISMFFLNEYNNY